MDGGNNVQGRMSVRRFMRVYRPNGLGEIRIGRTTIRDSTPRSATMDDHDGQLLQRLLFSCPHNFVLLV
ncbi:hypothetical protein EVAR_24058_1 [Eumeta japonica]|uniref:Uncharacterized protein n=1 Tax=Eumeta variegata TaxID=151549 RepID=A0A4C1VRI1_EUMVA|nr:hypothetical protein EVAR_24058_1 [Eumeta japonica]